MESLIIPNQYNIGHTIMMPARHIDLFMELSEKFHQQAHMTI